MKLGWFAILLLGNAVALADARADPTSSTPGSTPSLTVCADPNNLPFSNQARHGFENKIIELVAQDLHQPITYVWWAQRRGYVRNTLNDARCDLWPGIATGVDLVATSRPYYRSSYVFLTRADALLKHLSLDDPRLKKLQIGVQMIGNDSMNTPPAHAIASRGLTANVHGYMIYGNYNEKNAPAAIIEAVAQRQIDVALVWGPIAGYFASRSGISLRLEDVIPATESPWPMTFPISMGVRRGNPRLLDRINESLERQQSKIRDILERYHVPLEPLRASGTGSPAHVQTDRQDGQGDIRP